MQRGGVPQAPQCAAGRKNAWMKGLLDDPTCQARRDGARSQERTLKTPAMMFYPGDWMKDTAVRACSLAARGLWIDLLCLMCEGDRRGYLSAPSGKPYSLEQIARMTGCSTDEASRLLEELETSGVFSRSVHGTIFSRRIARDEIARANSRQKMREWRNSKKTKDRCNDSVTGVVTALLPLSSSSSSVTDKERKKERKPEVAIPPWISADSWAAFVEMRKKLRVPLTERGAELTVAALDRLRGQGEDPNACLDQSVSRGYRGVFAVKSGAPAKQRTIYARGVQ